MKLRRKILKLGIVGCGAIGSQIALSTKQELKNLFMVSALYDIDIDKAVGLSKRLRARRIVKRSIDELIKSSDIVAECVNTDSAADIVKRTLRAKKNILVMSVGRLLNQGSLFSLAKKNRVGLLLPSGAIAGLDAIKAARLAGIDTVTLTSRKPPTGFAHNAYLESKNIKLDNIKHEIVLFDGDVELAVQRFPQNINVGATLKLACGPDIKLRIRIVADPCVKTNSHEIILEGACGKITTKTENAICPDNPKTSYLAVLSAIATLRQYSQNIKVGT